MPISFPALARNLALVCVALPCASCALFVSAPAATSAAVKSTPADGLREALRVGTGRAVDSLGRAGGYLDNTEVRISVPPKLDKLAKGLRAIGAGFVVDDFVTAMNRAAEAAAPVAKTIFFDAVGEMSFSDAMAILRGRDHEATDYLEAHSRERLGELFTPIVADKLDSAGATRAFEQLVGEARKIPFMDAPAFDLDQFVTTSALDGLFLTIAREEEQIRRDPLARTTALLKKYFGQPI